MSIEATLATFKLTKDQVTATEKLFLLCCANRADENHECYPSLKRLMSDTGLDRKTIIKIRQSVIDKKLMIYTGRFVGRSNQIPVMNLVYVQIFEAHLNSFEGELTSSKNGAGEKSTGAKIGTGTSPKNGTGTSPKIGTLNLSIESIKRNIKPPISPLEKNEAKVEENKNNFLEAEEQNQLPTNIVRSDYCDNYKTEEAKRTRKAQKFTDNQSSESPTISQQLAIMQTNVLSEVTQEQAKDFDEFWDLYPRQSNKARTQAIWFQTGCQLIANQIITKLKEQIINDKSFLDGYIQLPANYLLAKSWENKIFNPNNKNQNKRNSEETIQKIYEMQDEAAKRRLEMEKQNNKSKQEDAMAYRKTINQSGLRMGEFKKIYQHLL